MVCTDAKGIIDTTRGSGRIEVFLHGATQKGNVGSSPDVATVSQTRLAEAAAIGIVSHCGTFVDDDIGVEEFLITTTSSQQSLGLRIQLRPCSGSIQLGRNKSSIVVVIVIGGIINVHRPGFLPSRSPVHTRILRRIDIGRWTIWILISLHIFLHRLCIEHMAQLTTTIDLPDLSATLQIHHGVFRPSVHASASTIDGAIGPQLIPLRVIAYLLIILDDLLLDDRHVDVHISGERTSFIVVATIDATLIEFTACRVVYQNSISTMVFHIRIQHIAGRKRLHTIGTTEDTTRHDGRACGNVDHRAACETLFVTATIDGTNLTTYKVDDSGMAVKFFKFFCRGSQIRPYNSSHTNAAPGTCPEDLHLLIVGHILRNVDKHIAAVL